MKNPFRKEGQVAVVRRNLFISGKEHTLEASEQMSYQIKDLIKQAPTGHGSDFLKDCPSNALC